ncbi:MAG: hypothetical protein AMS18_14205 [Gemmatimonas sp. SG8_17]|nr:MAG: hypothetical protein AMS18_14205 [Gemmatimonas sp. SG8_17]
MANHKRAALGFVVAPLAAPVAFWLVVTSPTAIRAPVDWFMEFLLAVPFAVYTGAPWAYGATVVVCVPTYLVLSRWSEVRLWPMMLAGIFSGAVTLPFALGLGLWTVVVGMTTGASGAGVFWLCFSSRLEKSGRSD